MKPMTADHEPRTFYDQLYLKQPDRNPAYKIYDGLRVNVIREMIGNQPGPLLIVGCGSNRDPEIIPPNRSGIAFDVSLEAIKRIQSNQVCAFVADALEIPLPEASFNVVVCSEVLEHIPDIRSAVKEFHRVLKPDGLLVVSSPNWMSWFGLARWVGEKITRRPIHSSGQPYDDWKTLQSYTAELAPEFEVISARGVWYLPPFHYRNTGLSEELMVILYRLFSPFESFLSRKFSTWGHLLVLCSKPK
jgi:SAM-dependent methyltransferase